MCELLASGQSGLNESQIFASMLERERLGSTGVGNGVAIPHSRMEGVESALIAFATLDAGVDYDSPDGEDVDMLFALLVPQECTEEHLKILASAAEMFSDQDFCQELRQSRDAEETFQKLTAWEPEREEA
ncbi:phosphotransferase system mannitol/fructose-specific IIA domain (Ntr-type) [gamma proteobacterium HTCC5015]|nr:phosphotransferase system mannitol/fructose-specific IIA domain (Ntr-type) [gamma proteobacterium HTCC5015]